MKIYNILILKNHLHLIFQNILPNYNYNYNKKGEIFRLFLDGLNMVRNI
jgi:hypothetical protein